MKAVGALGGVAVVAGAVAHFVSDHASKSWLQANKGKLDEALETHKAALSRETETHKLTLKRQELLFARELEAADSFMAVWRKLWPQYSRPEMEWHDAREDVALRLGTVEAMLEDYLERHSVAISATVRESIERARSEAASEKFFEDGPDRDPPKAAIDAAEHVLGAMRAARDTILNDLRR
ncbi:hypothetical protein AQZ50_12145 [Novosphingobium sp. Fuku2-ISO-50]|nr:hypothetical protein AQZ50_12145 [Novosphingobium sp. Fuku2-ISO-50]